MYLMCGEALTVLNAEDQHPKVFSWSAWVLKHILLPLEHTV